jgi:hypothetical protein
MRVVVCSTVAVVITVVATAAVSVDAGAVVADVSTGVVAAVSSVVVSTVVVAGVCPPAATVQARSTPTAKAAARTASFGTFGKARIMTPTRWSKSTYGVPVFRVVDPTRSPTMVGLASARTRHARDSPST